MRLNSIGASHHDGSLTKLVTSTMAAASSVDKLGVNLKGIWIGYLTMRRWAQHIYTSERRATAHEDQVRIVLDWNPADPKNNGNGSALLPSRYVIALPYRPMIPHFFTAVRAPFCLELLLKLSKAGVDRSLIPLASVCTFRLFSHLFPSHSRPLRLTCHPSSFLMLS